ncbi:class I SAM-dependent methyltransferase [Fodinicola acaciae]|uniref:class I SAM-dependent methyltransferase n=1 Tax=Fodinicola acaciae TaxID=2681555 RepID=UPI0013D6DB8A|nr:class I SAM-dependent methyltransferase [Fodinicola acaciae]
MAITLPAFTPVENSLFLTLYGRALDSRQPHSILHDTAAAEVVRKIGRDMDDFPMAPSKTFDIALRAKKLDDITRDFIARHPDAVALDLGAGLDNRFARVTPPSTVDAYEVDFADVVAVRRQVVSQPANVHQIAADLTDPHWLDAVPAGRPAVIVADGLTAFLSQDDLVALLRRLTGHFPCGELAFNPYTTFHVWAIKHYRGTDSIADVVKNPGMDDPHEPESWAPKLKLVEEYFTTRDPEVANQPVFIRFVSHLAARSTAWSRRGTSIARYTF